jgi:TPR repeat protein
MQKPCREHIAKRAVDGDSVVGNAEAMFSRAKCLRSGVGAAGNEAEAVAWYVKAAAIGTAKAMRCLGVCLRTGAGVAKNPGRALGQHMQPRAHIRAVYAASGA